MIYSQKFESRAVACLIAVTAVLAAMWVLEPILLNSGWWLRLALGTGCLAVAGAMFRLEATRRKRHARMAHQYVDTLCQQDLLDLAHAAEESSLPSLDQRNPWAPLLSRIGQHLIACAGRAEQAERACTGTEIRLRRLESEYSQLRDILQHLADPVVAVNEYDELILANLPARQLFDIEENDTANQSVEQQIDCEPLLNQLVDTRRRKSPTTRVSELQLSDQTGNSRWYRVSCRGLSLSDREGSEDHGAVAVLTDTSHEKVIQQRHAEFVAAASHEMKTPLAGIRAYVELLLDDEAEDDETREEFLGVISSQAERLQRLIENLLNLARIEAGVVSVDKQTQSLNELLETGVSVVEPAAEQKSIQLVQNLSPMYLGVLADRDMMMQSAINLLSNAIKYTREGGRVSIRSRMEDSAAVFEVEDTGVGLSEEDAKRVFEKFYRVKKDEQMAGGTGLGLPLAKHIVEDVHGGELTVTSQLGTGSVFRISLPVLSRNKL